MTIQSHRHGIPQEILALSHERDILRRRGQYERADALKQQIEDAGFVIKDNPHGAHLIILPSIEVDGKLYRTARQLPSLLDEADGVTFSVNILSHNAFDYTRRCVESVVRHAAGASFEIILVDNASQDGSDLWAETFRREEPRLRLLHATRPMGTAEARNVGLKQSRGRYILLLDVGAELTGDIFAPLEETLADGNIGVTGLHGLHTSDLRHFEQSQDLEVEAVDCSCMAFRRKLLKQVGLFDERYRYPHFMDVDFNFAIRDKGARAVVTPALPITYHAMPPDPRISEAERQRLTKRNFYRFLAKWGDREDLLLEA